MTPIKSILPFIQLGYYTAPLNGEAITRNDKGKKKGFSFTSDWKAVYSQTKNTTATPIGVILTGRGKNIVALDCDCTKSYDLFRTLDPTNTAVAVSIGKLDQKGNPISCGTFFYSYTEDLPENKSIKGLYDIDWINGVNSVFLPTYANTTKAHWYEEHGVLYNHDKQPVTVSPMPQIVKDTLTSIIEFKKAEIPLAKSVATTSYTARTKGYLGRLFQDIDLSDGYNPKVTKLLTPREFRSKKYQEQGHLHPNDIEGAGHEYLFKIMCHLAGDNTVDSQTAREVIEYINEQWDDPIAPKKLEQTIVGGIISGRQTNEAGEPYWTYDPNWESVQNFSIADKRGDLIEVFYDDLTKDYFVYNTQTDHIELFTKATVMLEHIRSIAGERFNQKESMEDMALVNTVVEPTKDFGYFANDSKFNRFEPTEALRIMADPDTYTKDYREPREFIEYMEGFIPDEQQRNYLLKLIKRKLITFEYSPVVPYIIGVQGSGKGLLMDILSNILGTKYVNKDVDGLQFINPFNKGMLEDKYIVNLNELSDTLNTKTEKNIAMGNLKNYTGSTQFQCHGKGKDLYSAPMKALFIMTANSNPLDVADDDRRVYYINTPQAMIDTAQVKASNIGVITRSILSQTKDIAYYLATEIGELSPQDYTTAPRHAGRANIIFAGKNAGDKIAWALAHDKFALLAEYLDDFSPLLAEQEEGKVFLDDIITVYSDMVNSDDPKGRMRTAMNNVGLKSKKTSRGGKTNMLYYYIPNIKDFEYKIDVTELGEEDDTRT